VLETAFVFEGGMEMDAFGHNRKYQEFRARFYRPFLLVLFSRNNKELGNSTRCCCFEHILHRRCGRRRRRLLLRRHRNKLPHQPALMNLPVEHVLCFKEKTYILGCRNIPSTVWFG
jgi:hypothetical protein